MNRSLPCSLFEFLLFSGPSFGWLLFLGRPTRSLIEFARLVASQATESGGIFTVESETSERKVDSVNTSAHASGVCYHMRWLRLKSHFYPLWLVIDIRFLNLGSRIFKFRSMPDQIDAAHSFQQPKLPSRPAHPFQKYSILCLTRLKSSNRSNPYLHDKR